MVDLLSDPSSLVMMLRRHSRSARLKSSLIRAVVQSVLVILRPSRRALLKRPLCSRFWMAEWIAV